MIKTLFAMFEGHIESFTEAPQQGCSLELAAAALLMEISRADTDVSEVERSTITAAIHKAFDLPSEEIDELIGAADKAVEEAVSLYEFTAVINEQFDREQKIELVEMLWRVAYADQELDQYEEYFVRKIADLLYVSHKDYIQAKHRVAN